MSLSDPTAVREQYATESDPREAVFDAVAERRPSDVPELAEPLVARRRPVVFVAEEAP